MKISILNVGVLLQPLWSGETHGLHFAVDRVFQKD